MTAQLRHRVTDRVSVILTLLNDAQLLTDLDRLMCCADKQGIVLGAGVGMIFGAALGDVGAGLVLGAGIGLVLGLVPRRRRSE